MKQLYFEILGWFGTIMVLGGYALASFGWISAESVLFQVMNILGSFGLLAIALSRKVYQSVVVNVVWATIGIVALIKLLI
ncbi:MAG: hypothetical protein NDI94_03205 [Candidatus Woesearchaeota archaeon]|nr:hypothetical protein [Candidatus Woesearchaeota archaeon]